MRRDAAGVFEVVPPEFREALSFAFAMGGHPAGI
jgi:hypothetical protein